jgi:hypothetical protein
VDAAERLAAYLAGELDADEHAAVEAALARDPVLRAELDHLQRADAALAALASPTPSDGFETRLRAALAAELTQQLGRAPDPVSGSAAATATDVATPTSPAERIAADELAAARARREARASSARGWRWLPVFGGVAASLLLIAVAINVVGPLGGDDSDTIEATSGDADLLDAMDDEGAMDDADGAEPSEGLPAEEDATGEAAAGQAEHAPLAGAAVLAAGPEVVVRGRDLDVTGAQRLLDVAPAEDLAATGLDAEAGEALADRWAAELGATTTGGQEAASDDADEGAPQDLPTDAGEPLAGLRPADRAGVGRCLTQVLATARVHQGPAIPAYVELLTVADEPAVAIVLVSADASGRFTVPQVRVVAADDCRVLATAER